MLIPRCLNPYYTGIHLANFNAVFDAYTEMS